VFAAFVSVVPAAARAQPAPPSVPVAAPPSAADEARTYYDLGLQHLAENRYQDAAVALERSQSLRALPVVTYNLALAYRGLGRYVAAIEAFERYLRRPDAGATPERLTAIAQELRELRRSLVRVTARVDPSEVTLQLDGRPSAPASGELVLDPGAHAFEWSADGYHSERREVQGTPGSVWALEVHLRPRQEGRILIEPSVTSARVLLDGRAVGMGRQEAPCATGEHAVEILASGYLPLRRTVRCGAAGMVRVDASLTREPFPVWGYATIITASVLVVAGVIVGSVVYQNSQVPEPRYGTWGSEQER
jgi:hypothetical protein